MFRLVAKKFRTASVFEKLLLVVGISVGVIGFWLINSVYNTEPGVNWLFVNSIFLWLILIFIIILTDSNESIKEELSIIIREHIEETRLLKEEMQLLRKDLSAKKKGGRGA